MTNKHYPITARFTKRFVKGDLQGTKVHESLGFLTVKDADAWHLQVSKAQTLDYVIDDFYIENPGHIVRS